MIVRVKGVLKGVLKGTGSSEGTCYCVPHTHTHTTHLPPLPRATFSPPLPHTHTRTHKHTQTHTCPPFPNTRTQHSVLLLFLSPQFGSWRPCWPTKVQVPQNILFSFLCAHVPRTHARTDIASRACPILFFANKVVLIIISDRL